MGEGHGKKWDEGGILKNEQDFDGKSEKGDAENDSP